jgi:hypothetical protein
MARAGFVLPGETLDSEFMGRSDVALGEASWYRIGTVEAPHFAPSIQLTCLFTTTYIDATLNAL